MRCGCIHALMRLLSVSVARTNDACTMSLRSRFAFLRYTIHSYLCFPFLHKPAQATEDRSIALGAFGTCSYAVWLYRTLDVPSVCVCGVNLSCMYDEFDKSACVPSLVSFICISTSLSFANQHLPTKCPALHGVIAVCVLMLCGCIAPSTRSLSVSVA